LRESEYTDDECEGARCGLRPVFEQRLDRRVNGAQLNAFLIDGSARKRRYARASLKKPGSRLFVGLARRSLRSDVDLGHYTIPVIVKNDCSLQAIATLWRYVKLAEKNRVGEPAFI
jgi:hypothetical protein